MSEKFTGGQASDLQRGDHADNHGGQARDNRGDQARNKYGGQARNKYTSCYKPTSLRICQKCSYKQLDPLDRIRVKHKHFSSKSVREFSGAASYFCPTCKAMHTSEMPSRLKICVSSSTLHEFWAPRDEKVVYEGDKVHVEYITIPGAQILDLLEAWKIDYWKEQRSMDVLIVAGLNNITHGQAPDSIMRDFDHFVRTVQYQAALYHPETPNMCAIGTMFYPPQLCWFPDSGPCPGDFHDHMEDMRWLNYQIERLNDETGIKVPNFTTLGLRVNNKATKNVYGYVSVRHSTTHRLEHWREKEPRDMLHLNDRVRIKMGRWVGKWFLHETGNT